MKTKTTCITRIAGKETEQAVTLKTVTRDGDRHLLVEIGDLAFWIKADYIEAAMTMREVKRLHKKIEELEFQHQLDLSQITYQRRQIDFLMEDANG